MAMLDVLACDTRLTSAGLAYAFRGFNSIFKTLRRRYEDSLLEADVLHSVKFAALNRFLSTFIGSLGLQEGLLATNSIR